MDSMVQVAAGKSSKTAKAAAAAAKAEAGCVVAAARQEDLNSQSAYPTNHTGHHIAAHTCSTYTRCIAGSFGSLAHIPAATKAAFREPACQQSWLPGVQAVALRSAQK